MDNFLLIMGKTSLIALIFKNAFKSTSKISSIRQFLILRILQVIPKALRNNKTLPEHRLLN